LRLPSKNLLLLLLVALVAGCGGDDDAADTATSAQSDVRVALVTDVGQLNDRGFNQLAYEGLKQAEKDLGVAIRVV
jgi:basic membrane protein A